MFYTLSMQLTVLNNRFYMIGYNDYIIINDVDQKPTRI